MAMICLLLTLLVTTAGTTLPDTSIPPAKGSVPELPQGINNPKDGIQSGEVELPPELPDATPLEVSAPLDPMVQAPSDWWTEVFQAVSSNGSWDIFRYKDFFEGPLEQLTFDASNETKPAFNPLKNKILFVSNRTGKNQVYLQTVGKNDAQRIGEGDYFDDYPVWDPDMESFFFIRSLDGRGSQILGYSLQNLASPDSVHQNYGGWVTSPTINRVQDYKIAFLEMISDNFGRIMNGFDFPKPVTDYFQYPQHLRWSPDGQKLALDCDYNLDGWNEVVVMDADGSDIHVVSPYGSYLTDYYMGSWTPDSQSILFTRVVFVIQNNYLYMAGTEELRLDLLTGNLYTRGVNSGFTLNPSVSQRDAIPPKVWLEPLPAYLRENSTVRWHATDEGGSGVASVDLEYFDAYYQVWIPWIHAQGDGEAIFPGAAGNQYSIRISGKDDAGNISDNTDPNTEASFSVYRYVVQGRLTDNRGYSYQSGLSTNCPSVGKQLDTQGGYQVYLSHSGDCSLYFTSPGSTNSWRIAKLNVISDQSFDFYLGSPNSFSNGDFENSAGALTDWIIDNAADAAIISGYASTNAVRLGSLGDVPVSMESTTTLTSQPVTIDTKIIHPTLAWMGKLETNAAIAGDSSFEVWVTDGENNTTSLFVSKDASPWNLQWVDLSPWSGQTITIVFALHQAVGELPVQVSLDDLSISKWTTHVIEAIDPQVVASWSAGTTLVHLKGQNLGAGYVFIKSNTPTIFDIYVSAVATPEGADFYVPSKLTRGEYKIRWSGNGETSNIVIIQLGLPLKPVQFIPIVTKQ
jgi:hypothetical protein